MKNLLLILSVIFCEFSFCQDSLVISEKMKQILKQISIEAIELGDYNFDFTKGQMDSTWIGYESTPIKEIEKVEKRLGIALPNDYREFLLITNGFHAATSVEPSFCTVDKIDFLKNVDSELLEIWNETGTSEVGIKLNSAIKVGGFDEEQYFFLIPPSKYNPNWEYWVFATWIPGETIYNSLIDYFNSVLETTTIFVKIEKNISFDK